MELSETTQKFKIGRITYVLPSVVFNGGAAYLLCFESINEGREWKASYKCNLVYTLGDVFVLDVYAETFNGAIKKLHAKIKKIEA